MEQNMQFISYRELGNNALSDLRKKSICEGALVTTSGNKPIAAMISLDDENFQDTLLFVSQIRAQMAANAIHNKARRDGLNRMTLKEVNTLIKKARMK